jgi:two-component sensor histidine kinase
MGMTLIKMLAEQLGARFYIEVAGGTIFTATLPSTIVVPSEARALT